MPRHDLVLLRHGQTARSLSGQHTGHTDIPLTTTGEAQALALAPALASWEFAATWCSPLQRALRNAQLAGLRGVKTSEDLREWDYGAYEGRRTTDIQAERANAGEPPWNIWRDGVPAGATPGEDAPAVARRVDDSLEQARLDLAAGPVLAIAHAHVLRVLAARWLGQHPRLGSAFPLDACHLARLGHEHGLPTVAAIVVSVLIFLGIPLVAGFLTRTLGERARGRDWYEQRFLPRLGPWALYGLLLTVVLLFALQGDAITSALGDVARIALPLLAYFVVMFGGSFALGRAIGLDYARTTTLSFTAAGNDFELTIAVAIGTFGVTSGQALAGVVGPLIEVPVLVALVYAALWAGRRFFPHDPTAPSLPQTATSRSAS